MSVRPEKHEQALETVVRLSDALRSYWISWLAQSFYNSALQVDYGRFGSSICVHLSICGLFNHPLSIPNREIREIGDLKQMQLLHAR